MTGRDDRVRSTSGVGFSQLMGWRFDRCDLLNSAETAVGNHTPNLHTVKYRLQRVLAADHNQVSVVMVESSALRTSPLNHDS